MSNSPQPTLPPKVEALIWDRATEILGSLDIQTSEEYILLQARILRCLSAAYLGRRCAMIHDTPAVVFMWLLTTKDQQP